MTFAIEMISQYGYYAVFGLLALGIIGLPVPDELLMLFIGYLCSIMVLNYSMSLLVSFMGAISGMLLSYTLGKTFGQPLIDKHGKWVGLTTKRFEKVKGWFARFGLWTLFFGYFIPGVRSMTSYISGITSMPFRKYLLVTSLGSLTWVLIFVTIGYFLGASIKF